MNTPCLFSSWYFPSLDISISVLMNDGSKNSWTLAPVIVALLRTYTNYIASTTAINEIDNSVLGWSVYPNPVLDKLNLTITLNKHAENIHVTLTNILGETIRTTSLSDITPGQHILEFENIETISKGIYIATLYLNGTKVGSEKIIK